MKFDDLLIHVCYKPCKS